MQLNVVRRLLLKSSRSRGADYGVKLIGRRGWVVFNMNIRGRVELVDC